ncbi:hypothetical protein [Pendulispora albinea]|uniref:Class I SAM-dependent methyltransferase n=1 Tax=Pendulispora albinea TaxID=2741071 RepID=A0ABZ2MA67_9BACT
MVWQDAFFAGLLAELCPRAQRSRVTTLLYERAPEYRRGGAFFDVGLFAWEQRLFREGSAFPREGTILVGGVGGGRLLGPLLARGHRILGFDPSRLLDEAEVVAGGRDVKLATGRYQDLGPALQGEGPLAELVAGEDIRAIILAFGSMMHITPGERRELFSNLRALAPAAPVFASFMVRRPNAEYDPIYERTRAALRRIGHSHPDDHVDFIVGVGFLHMPSRDEVAALCHGAGYDLTEYSEMPYGTAVALPRPP